MNQFESPPKSMTARIYKQLRSDLLDIRHKPGDRLRIDALSSDLSGSAGAIREALSRLTAEGLVVATPQKGFVVAPVSKADLVELTEVRVHVECVCLELAIKNGDIAWEGNIISAYHQLSRITKAVIDKGPPYGDWPRLHELFHDELTAACGNRWWLRMRRQLFAQSERYRRLSTPYSEGGRDVDKEHKEIVDATLQRDAALAKALISRHLRETTEILLRSGCCHIV